MINYAPLRITITGPKDIAKNFRQAFITVKSDICNHLESVTRRAKKNIIETVTLGRTRASNPYKNPRLRRFSDSWEISIEKRPQAQKVPFFFGGVGLIMELNSKCPYYIRINDGFLPPASIGSFGEGTPLGEGMGEYFKHRSFGADPAYLMVPRIAFPGFHYLEKTQVLIDHDIKYRNMRKI